MQFIINRAVLLDIFVSLFNISNGEVKFENYPHALFAESYARLTKVYHSASGVIEPYLGVTQSGVFVPDAIYRAKPDRDFTFSDMLADLHRRAPIENYRLLLEHYFGELMMGDFTMDRIMDDSHCLEMMIKHSSVRGKTANNLLACRDCTTMLNMFITTFYLQYKDAVEREERHIKITYADEYMRVKRLLASCKKGTKAINSLPEKLQAAIENRPKFYCVCPLMPYSHVTIHLAQGDLLCVGLFPDNPDIPPEFILDHAF